VVRPRFAGGQVSGLGTLLSGSNVGIDPGKAANSRRKFTGLETAPIVTGDRPDWQFVLRADELVRSRSDRPCISGAYRSGRSAVTKIRR
jgi:paraquat-inducible protein B